MLTRRKWLQLTITGTAIAGSARRLLASELTVPPTPITVYKSPSCGCCAKWVDHMKAANFAVTVKDMDDVNPVKDEMGVPEALRSCHTGLVAGYVVEGHVPADVIQQALKEKPKVLGIAVPGMPVGTPGMEMGGRKDKYDVVSFDKAGKTKVYASR
jgi:hypothetical protein